MVVVSYQRILTFLAAGFAILLVEENYLSYCLIMLGCVEIWMLTGHPLECECLIMRYIGVRIILRGIYFKMRSLKIFFVIDNTN